MGISGGIFDGHLGNDYIIRDGIGMEALPHTDTQCCGPELAGYSYEQPELLSMRHEDISDVLHHNCLYGPDINGIPSDTGHPDWFKTVYDEK
jgi:hypothetical protein